MRPKDLLAALYSILALPLFAGAQVDYFDTGLPPDGGYPGPAGIYFANFTPAQSMIITGAQIYINPDTTPVGSISWVDLFQNKTLTGQGIGDNGFYPNGQPHPAVFSQPLSLAAGESYGIEISIAGYADAFHTNEIFAVGGTLTELAYSNPIDGLVISGWFPGLQFTGPVPEPSTAELVVLGSVAFAVARLGRAACRKRRRTRRQAVFARN